MNQQYREGIMAKSVIAVIVLLLFFAFNVFAGSRGYHRSSRSYSSGSHYKSSGDVHVRGYTKKNGTYVQPHHRTAPNNSRFDNYSTKGNVNPYTGKEGTKDPFKK